MWLFEKSARLRPALRLVLAFAAAGLTAGCFQPLYGDQSVTGGPGIKEKLSSVDVQQIEAANGTPIARVAQEVRNSLIFDLTGGGVGSVPTYRLKINLSPTRQQIIVDTTTARPEFENYGIDATYSLTEIATNKVVATGRTFSRVSYDIPGQQQRFMQARGLRDAENRAAKVLAEQIQSRLASFFVTGS